MRIKPLNYYPCKSVCQNRNRNRLHWLPFCKFSKWRKSAWLIKNGTLCYNVVHHPPSTILLLYMWCLGKSSNNYYFLCVKFMTKMCLIFTQLQFGHADATPTRFKLWNNNVQSLVLMYGKLLFSCPFYIEKLWLKLINFYNVTNLVEAVWKSCRNKYKMIN